MVAGPEPCAMGLCHFSGPRWAGFPPSVSSDEKRVRQRHIPLCCYGVPEIESQNVAKDRLDSFLCYISRISIPLTFAVPLSQHADDRASGTLNSCA